ncbi:MAG: NYN domain-containing protein [Eubacteriales bacterium]
MSQLSDLRLAVLIDADNIPRKSLKSIMEEIAIYGTPTVKRIYGDFTKPELSGWKNELLENAVTPIQQFGYTTGKNSTDSAMIIDAMDILYEGKVDGFCIVSSDSDFTRLALRLRESGVKVLGFGERKTPQPFIVACDKFIYIEVLISKMEAEENHAALDTKKKHSDKGLPKNIIKLLSDSISDIGDEDGWAFLGELGNLILKKQPDFDPRNFGFRSLTPLVKSVDRFEIDARETNSPHIKHIYVRVKK